MLKIIFLVLILILANLDLHSQCGCMSSMASGLLSPSMITQTGTLREGIVLVNLFTNYTYGDKEYSSTKVVPNSTVKKFWNSALNFKASYGFTKKLTGTIGTSYITQNNIKTFVFDYQTSGWNNVQIGAKYNLIFNPKDNHEITAMADLSIPLQSVDDTTYTYLQPTTGALAYSLGLFYHKGFSEYEIDFFSFWSSTFNSKNTATYQFGSVHSLTFAVTKPIIKQIAVGLIGNFSYKDKDKLQGVVQVNSGYKNATISPQISLLFQDFVIGLNSELPIYNEYFGSQMSKSFSVGINLQYKMDTN